MITLNLYIMRPKWLLHNIYKSFIDRAIPVAHNKCLEFELYYAGSSDNIVELETELGLWGKDHAGSRLELVLFGIHTAIRFYDCRHWDYETNTWEPQDEDRSEDSTQD